MPIQAVSSGSGRQIIDSNYSNSTAIGTAGSTVQSATFDLGSNDDGWLPETIDLIINIPACPSLAAPGVATALTFTVLADTATTPTTALPIVFTVAGTSGTGSVSVVKNIGLSGNTARYLAVQVAAGANAGNNSSVSFTTSLGF